MSKKIQDFIKRNRRRNEHLYSNTALVENYDYIVCPHTLERMTMIKSTYITSVLGMSVEEYDALYPGILKEAPARSAKVKTAMAQFDETTGKTKRELSNKKLSESLSKQLDDGQTIAQARGKLSAKTRTETVLENGLTIAQNAAAKGILKGNATKAARGDISTANSDIEMYRRLVKYLIGAKVGRTGYELKLKINDAYAAKVSPVVVAGVHNLATDGLDGTEKHRYTSEIDAASLVNISNYTPEQSIAEFNLSLDLLRECVEEHGQLSCGVVLEKLNDAEVRKKYGL